MNPDYVAGSYDPSNPYAYAGTNASNNNTNPWAGVDSGNTGASPSSSGAGGSTMAGAGIGAGLGILQALGQQKAYQAQMNQLQATTRYSPWTKMSMAQPTVPNAVGTIMGSSAGGAAQGQAMGGGSALPLAMMMAG
jgi:hypothetical protein